jgi:hypothetical protein
MGAVGEHGLSYQRSVIRRCDSPMLLQDKGQLTGTKIWPASAFTDSSMVSPAGSTKLRSGPRPQFPLFLA